MKVFEERTDALKPYPYNAKEHSEAQIADVAESIRRYGFVQPVVIDENNEIIIGHCRTEAAKRLGLETVPCVRVTDLTEEQIRELRIVDNKTNESPWNPDLLRMDIVGLDFSGFSFSFDDIMIDVEEYPEIDVEEYPEISFEDAVPRVKPGEIWRLGDHRLMCGDSTKAETYSKLMGGGQKQTYC